jgi:transposase
VKDAPVTKAGAGSIKDIRELTAEDRASIAEKFEVLGFTHQALADRFSVSKATIANVIKKSRMKKASDHSPSPNNTVEKLRADIAKDHQKLLKLNQRKLKLESQREKLEKALPYKKQALEHLLSAANRGGLGTKN